MDGFEIRTSNSKKGKGLFATRNFAEGDIILEEDPLVSCQFAWNAAYRYLACDYCMRPLETPEQNVRRLASKPDIVLPHPDCVDSKLDQTVSCDQCRVLYCSESCKVRAYESYHRTLCHDPSDSKHPIVLLMETWKPMHYPPETTNIMLLVRILAYIQQHPEPASAAATVKQFCHRTVNEDAELVHKLLGAEFTSQLGLLREMTASVVSGEHVQEFLTPEGFSSLVALIGSNGQGVGTSPLAMWVNSVQELTMSDDERAQIDTFIDKLYQYVEEGEFLTPEGFSSLVALIGSNGQGVGTSPLAMWVNSVQELTMSDDERAQIDTFIDKLYQYVEEESGTFLNTEGSALYRLQSACNHSCSPNAESTFPFGNHRVLLRASADIRAGAEIYISYLGECELQRSRHSRQKELAQNYLFVCWCERCTEQASQPDVTSDEEMSDDEDIADDDD